MKNFTRFTALPDDPYVPYRKRKKAQEPRWTAPEHGKAARNMKREYPVDHNGRRMVELGKELVLDPRPEIMRPKPVPIFMGVDNSP